MTLQVVPEGLAATGAAIEAITARLMAAHASAASTVTVVTPPGADPVSVQSTAAFSARGDQHTTAATEGAAVLGSAGAGVGLAGAQYAAGDAAAAATYLGGGR